ncbi:hypothetical protein SO802_010517 [Lithocarpus litseifolius]|uniref:Uncharacterized protein n=1 Tax=Lithocarpus litseifolius TaxID=425828 RepID=A0AAW2DEF6_9ROSI
MSFWLTKWQQAVNGIALPLRCNKLCSGSSDGTVRLWDCHTGQCANVINLGGEVGSVCSEGPWLFVGMPNVVKVWNTESGAEYSLNGPVGQVNALESINDLLFAGVEVWDLENWQCSMTLNGHDDVVKSLMCWDKYLFSGSLDCTIKVWASTEDGSLEVIYIHSEEHGILALSGMTDPPMLNQSCIALVAINLSTSMNCQHSLTGRLFAKQEVQTLQIGPGGLFFTGD